MARVRAKDTTPEWLVRRAVHKMGFRYRLHRADLPGKPDMVFPRLKKIIFVHGCFWHLHAGCPKSRLPASNTSFWRQKLERNRERDEQHRIALEAAGWSVLVLWECELRDPQRLDECLIKFLTD
nr:very short patch repair endonuclease [Noviherbaspirillum sp. UKPF54]